MNYKSVKGFLAVVLTLAMVVSIFSGFTFANDKIETLQLADETLVTKGDVDPNADVTIMVKLDGPTAFEATKSVKASTAKSDELLQKQAAMEKVVEARLNQGIDVLYNYTLLYNGFAFEGKIWMIDEINKISGVSAYAAPVFETPVLPNMGSSTEIIGAPIAWQEGYTGEGGVVAILDTGIRATHEAFSVNPDNITLSRDALQAIVTQYGSYMHAGTTVNSLYKSDKIPFGWDYKYNDYDPNHGASDHGTHVAGTAAGNNGDDFKGVAPDAQLVVMQVFSATGGASFTEIIAALEDCVYLGVDSANMSLGSPAGFTAYYDPSYGEIFDLLEEAGVNLSVSAGNEFSQAEESAFDGYVLAMNPDSGLVGSPSTWNPSLSIASSDNASVSAGSITVGNHTFGFSETSGQYGLPLISSIPGTYDFVMCGLGNASDFNGVDVDGKVAVISRGDISFIDKITNAYNAGAIAAIIYNNAAGVINMDLSSIGSNVDIPAVSITAEAGTYFEGQTQVTIGADTFIDMSTAGAISSFSSRGTTADLRIKPELTAPGGSINSAIGFGNDNSYETWSGTSMAAPHVAGGFAIVKAYLRELYPNASATEIKELADALLMSTATPLNELVRSQGAGLMNLTNALAAPAYLSVDANYGSRPKLELGENENGTFSFEFDITGLPNADTTTFTLGNITYIDTPYELGTVNDQTIYATKYTALNISTGVNVTFNSNTVTVAAGQTVTVTGTISANDDLLAEIGHVFPSGSFLEGFITLNYGAGWLNIPYLGFIGDWDEPAMLDRGFYWNDACGEANLQTNGSLSANVVGYKKGNSTTGLGLNLYADMPEGSYNPDRNAISPNGDGVYDAVNNLEFGLLRNARMLTLDLDNTNLYTSNEYDWRKDYYYSNGGYYTSSSLTVNITGSGMAENETSYLVLSAFLDHEGFTLDANENGKWIIPITLDTVAPEVAIVDGAIAMTDVNYLAYYAVYSDEAMTSLVTESGVFEDERGLTETYAPNADVVYVMVADYAGNTASYKVDIANNTVTPIEGTGPVTPGETTIWWEESFEDQSTYSNWHIVDNDGDGDYWNIYNEASQAAEGSLWAGSKSWDQALGAITPNNWLFSNPGFEMPANAKISFKVNDVGGHGEHFEFLIGPMDAMVGTTVYLDMFDTILAEDVSGGSYTEYTVDLSEYEGQQIFVAWRHCDCSDGFYLALDDIKIFTPAGGDEPDPTPSPDPEPGDALFGEFFEEDPTVDWTFVDADGDGNNWIWDYDTTLESYEGVGHIRSESYINYVGAVTPDNWAISPEMTIPANAVDATLSFYFAAQDPAYAAEPIGVYVGTGADVSAYEQLGVFIPDSDVYENITVDLTAYAGETISVAFRHFDITDMFSVKIDQVEVFVTAEEEPPVPETYTVTFIDGLTEEIIEEVEVEAGGTVVGPFAPEHEGYNFIDWDVYFIDNNVANAEMAYATTNLIFENVSCDINAVANYEEAAVVEPTEYTVSINHNEFGTTDPEIGTYAVVEGEEIAITITPNDGYMVQSVLVNGVEAVSEVTENVLTLTITNDTDVEVVFTKIPKTGAITLTSMAIMSMISGAAIVIFKKR